MGTRSSYRVIERYYDTNKQKKLEQKLINVYHQYDGYPDGHPLDTFKWLSKSIVVNGIGSIVDENGERPINENDIVFNGASCLAAQLIAKQKDGVGGVYVKPISSFGKCWENYLYDIIVDFNTKEITIKAYHNGKRKTVIFEGTPVEYVEKFSKVEVE